MSARLGVWTLALAIAVLPATAHAYVFMETCPDDTGAAWDLESVITWHLSSTFASQDLDESVVRSAVDAGFAAWNAPHCADVSVVGGEDLAVDPFGGDESVVFGFYEDEWPPELGVGLLALTRISVSGDCEIIDGDIAFNGVDHTWINGTPTLDEVDFRAVATHELGHVLGVDHTPVGGSTMFTSYDYDTSWRDIACDDTGAICALYPSFDASCTDSSLCPCTNLCVGGWCSGYRFEGGECWERFLPEEPSFEGEPNDTSQAAELIIGEGGDFVVSGSSATCGNDGTSPNADQDWMVFDAPCDGTVWISLEPSALDADVDLFVFDDGEPAGSSQNRVAGREGREGLEVEVGQRFQALVYCWEGAATDWTLTVHYLSPGEQAGWPDPGPDCGCSTGRSTASGLVGLMLLLGVVVRRRDR